MSNDKVWIVNDAEVRDDGLYIPLTTYSQKGTSSTYKKLFSKEDFIKCYEKWIREGDTENAKSPTLPSEEEYFEQKKQTYRNDGFMLSTYSEPLYMCPKCGGQVRRNETMVLTSYPPQYRFECDNCGYVTSHI